MPDPAAVAARGNCSCSAPAEAAAPGPPRASRRAERSPAEAEAPELASVPSPVTLLVAKPSPRPFRPPKSGRSAPNSPLPRNPVPKRGGERRAEKCIERLQPLLDMGLQHIYQLGGTPVAHPHGARQIAMVEQAQLFATDVIPHCR